MNICTDGLFYSGTSLQSSTLYFDLTSGFWEPAEVSGKPVLIPGRPGFYTPTVNPYEKRRRIVQLEGWTMGAGSGYDEQRASWAEANDTLAALLDRTLGDDDLVVVPPYMGVDLEWTLLCRVLNVVTSPPQNRATRQRWSIQFESTDNPPEWVGESPSSS